MSDFSSHSSQERFANLNDSNFLEWKDNMLALLKARGLRAHIDTARDASNVDDQKAQGLITMKVEYAQRAHVFKDTDCAHAVWSKLCAKYEQVGTQLALSCISGMYYTRYQEGTKLEEHIVKMREHFTRLEASGNVLTEAFQVGFIVFSLPPSWAVFKEIHTAAAGQTVSSVCIAALTERDRRLNEERSVVATQSLALSQQLETSPSALAVREAQAAAARAARKASMTCAFCRKQGHEEEDCWAKHGMPARNARRNNAIFASEPTVAPTDTAHYVFTALSTTPAESGVWYLDTGASNHCCREQSLVDSVQPCARSHVVSGHGSPVPIVGSGTVTISVAPAVRAQPDRIITLTDVYLVPGLATNVVSAARLTQAGLNVSFSNSLCVIQHGKQVVAVADLEEANNLYRLRTGSANRAAVTESQDVCFVESQLGIKAWGATTEFALPASLQPELASIESEDDEPPALAPSPNAPPPLQSSRLLQQPQRAATPPQAAQRPQPDLAPASAAPAPAATPPRRPLPRELRELQGVNEFGRLDPEEASFLGNGISRYRARHSISAGQSAYITSLLERHSKSDCKPPEHAAYDCGAHMLELSEFSSRGGVSAAS